MVQEGQSWAGAARDNAVRGPCSSGTEGRGSLWSEMEMDFSKILFFSIGKNFLKNSCHRRWIRMKSESTEVKKGRDS